MKRYKVETQREGSVKYFFIRDMESLEIVVAPKQISNASGQVRIVLRTQYGRKCICPLPIIWEYLAGETK